MATRAAAADEPRSAEPRPKPLTPDRFEKILAAGSVLMLVAVLSALAKGRGEWHLLPATVWLHLATIILALVLTPLMLLRRRGDWLHRRLGWIWCIALAGTAVISFWVRTINPGGLSWIHLLSAWTLLQVPLIIWSARTHNVKRHRSSVRGMVTGALLIAGVFTFPFGRLMGRWLFG